MSRRIVDGLFLLLLLGVTSSAPADSNVSADYYPMGHSG